MTIPILYEDDDVVVIDKPSGISVHRDEFTSSAEETIADWHVARTPHVKDVGEPHILKNGDIIARHGVVHRLDRETSGVLILAKNQDAFLHLKQQFHDRLVSKTYYAFVHGEMKEKRGTIDRAIGRSAKDFRMRSAQRGAKGTLREAVTHFEVLQSQPLTSYVMLRPETGRTHQLRVHLKAINHPIVCDTVYGPTQGCILGFSRLALHAFSLTLVLPSGKTQLFEAPLPREFEKVLAEFGK